MNAISVSIIIPVYNTEQYLRQCLDTVINQTFQDIEIIVVNDGSTDNSINIIKEYQQKDSRIVLISFLEHKDVSFVRNEGLKNAKGQYITFVDSDDWVSKDYIKILYENIVKYNVDIVATNFYFYERKNKSRKYKYPSFCYKANFSDYKNKMKLFTLRFIWNVWGKIYKRSFIYDNKFAFKGKYLEDTLFNYRTFLIANNIKFIDENTYFYRTFRKGSVTLNEERVFFIYEVLNEIKNILVYKNLYQQYKQSFYSFSYLLLASEIERSNLSKQEIKEICCKIKSDILKNTSIKIKIFDSFPQKVRTHMFSFCFRKNFDYNRVGNFFRRIYLFFRDKFNG